MTRDQLFFDQGTAARNKRVARGDCPYGGGTRRGVLWTLGWDRRECQIAHAEHRVPNIPEAALPAPAPVAARPIEREAPVKIEVPLCRRMNWSQDQINALYAGLRRQATGIELAREIGIGLIEIFYKALEFDLGLPARFDGQGWKDADDADIARMREARYSARLIGFAIGRKGSAVSAHFAVLRKAGRTIPSGVPKRLFRRVPA